MTRHTFADDELTALLERAIPSGPEGPALSTVVRAGGQALRRRRLALGSAVTAAAVVAGAGALVALGGGGRPGAELAPAVDPGPTETTQQPDPTAEPDDPLGEPGEPLVELRADGTLDLAPGVEVLERIDNPAGQPLPNRSVAVSFSYEGRERWAVLQVLVDEDGDITGGGVATTYANRAEQLESLTAYARANDEKVYHP